ncbi:MAG: DUF5916 domain-containing protein [Gemmatimonadota bacterium]
MLGFGLVAFVLFAGVTPVLAQTQEAGGGPVADPGAAPFAAISTPAVGAIEHEERAPQSVAVRLEGTIDLDGRLDEAAWRAAPAIVDFHQKEPVEGVAPTQRTEVRFLYDGGTLYVGARMFDDEPDRIVGRLVRRDANTNSDEIRITFDTFLDHLGETYFAVNPRGVRSDAYGPGGSGLDESWNPVWRASAHVDELGWTAEMAIPFSQLRFPQGVEQVWGLQVERTIERTNEYIVWSFWPRGESGGPSRFGHLSGIAAPESGTNRLELLPYVVGQYSNAAIVNRDDPFSKNTDGNFRLGADAKYLLTSNLTLSATINPDFGQAEVDPAVVNLSAFETFFPEKREFFIEGSGLFDFGGLWCFTCSNQSSLGMLFTRRIGRSPQGRGLARDAGQYFDAPDASTILGAAKITGRTAGGMSIGVIEAMTQREQADVMGFDGVASRKEVAPFTNYFASRVKQDFMDGDLQLGGIFTSVARAFDDPDLESILNSHSEGFGIDGEYWWADRNYHLMADFAVTNVAGSPEAIDRVQRSSARYFQRPDRETEGDGLFSNAYDPTRTSLRGYGTYTRIAKESGSLRWESQLNVRSPGFENNDFAFLSNTDFIGMLGNVQYRWRTPNKTFRWLQTTLGAQQRYNFDGDLTDRQYHSSSYMELPSFWEISLFARWRPEVLDDGLTRGGPVVARAGSGFIGPWVGTDDRKKVRFEFNPEYGWSTDGGEFISLWTGITFKPASSVSLSINPSFNIDRSTAQYVTAVDDPTAAAFFGRRYVFADLEQKTFAMTTRLNWTFTPDMSLELFLQPFISSNDFSNFKQFDAPRQVEKSVYGQDVGTIRTVDPDEPGGNRSFVIDPDGDGPAAEFGVNDPDFNFRSLRGNLVFRWEYIPGSTLFFVWTQDRNTAERIGTFDLGHDSGRLFDTPADNIFLIKATYWLGL